MDLRATWRQWWNQGGRRASAADERKRLDPRQLGEWEARIAAAGVSREWAARLAPGLAASQGAGPTSIRDPHASPLQESHAACAGR